MVIVWNSEFLVKLQNQSALIWYAREKELLPKLYV